MDGGFITYDQAVGAAPFDPPSTPTPPAPTPPASDDADAHVLTVHRRPQTSAPVLPQDDAAGAAPAAVQPVVPPPAPAAPPDAASPVVAAPVALVLSPADADTSAAASPAPQSNWISYEQATTPPTPNPGGVLSNSADDGYLSGAAKGLGTAGVKAIGNTLGFAGGIHDLVAYLVARGEHAITGRPVDTILAENKAAQDKLDADSPFNAVNPMRLVPAPDDVSGPILKQTGSYTPTSTVGKLAQAGAETVLSSLGPGAGAAGGTAAEVLSGAAKMAPATFAAGAAAQGVTDATGDPLLGLAAGAVTPVAAHIGATAAGKIAGPAFGGASDALGKIPVIGPAIQNAATGAAENTASRRFVASASDPDAVKAGLIAFDPTAAPEVPGTMPTPAGLTRDPGLLQAEMTARGPGGANVDFNQRDAVQNSARIAALQSIQPEGDVFRPGQYVTQNLQAVDAAAQRAQEQLEAAHAAAVAARAQDNQVATDRLAQSFQAAHDQLLQTAQDGAAPLADLPPAEQTGAVLRTAQQEATKAKAEIHRALYDAVDPDGTLTASTSSLKAAKAAIAGAIDPHAGVQPSGAEAKLWTDIDRMPDAIPFKSLQKIDSRVTAAMADAKRNPNPEDPEAHGRLTELKTATLRAIDSSVENQAAHEAKLVQAGVLPEQDAMTARLLEALRKHAGAQADARATGVASGGGFDPATAGDRPGVLSRGGGADGAPNGGPRAAPGDQGIPPAPRAGAQQPDVTAGLSYEAPALGDRTISAQMHAPETAAALGQDVPGTHVRPFSGPLDPRGNLPQGIVAFHGSPHEFDRFDLSKIGTGEGNLAFGRGAYLAENPAVAKTYQDMLASKGDFVLQGADRTYATEPKHIQAAHDHIQEAGGDIDRAISEARGAAAKGFAQGDRQGADYWTAREQTLQAMKDLGYRIGSDGHLYQVRVDRDPEHFLDWEAKFPQQSPYTQAALQKVIAGSSAAVRDSIAKRGGVEALTGAELEDLLGSRDVSDAQSAARLKDAGIAGVRYLDNFSRKGGAGATRNYVVFDDRDIQVTHRSGLPLVRPQTLPDMIKGNARAAFVPELIDAGLTPASFSTALKSRAEQLLNSGERADHGRALEQAAISADPKEVQDAIFGGSTQGRGSNAQRDGGAAGDFGIRAREPSGQGSRSRQPREAGRASSESIQPVDTPEAAGRLKQAKAAYIEFKHIHDNPIVRGALETNGFNGQYLAPDSTIPSKWIVKGGKGFETAGAFLRASSGDPRAIEAMKNAVLAPLRKGVLSNGTLHPRVVERWKSPDEYGPALRAIDSVSPGFAASYDNAARATQTLMDAGLEQKRQLEDFQRQAAARALSKNAASKAAMSAGLADIKAQTKAAENSAPGKFAKAAGNAVAPTEVENVVGGMLQTKTGGAARMREMVQSLKADPDALAGFRNAAVNWIVRTHLGATEAATSGEKQIKGASLISFLIDNRDTLKELFPHPQVTMFGAVARSIETDARWIAATAPKNGPGTAKDMAPRFSDATKATAKHTSMAVVASEGLREGFDRGGWTGAALAGGAAASAYLINLLRQAGIRKSDALYQRMLLDPEFARLMISKMPENLEGSKWHALTRALRLQLIMGAPAVETAHAKHRMAG